MKHLYIFHRKRIHGVTGVLPYVTYRLVTFLQLYVENTQGCILEHSKYVGSYNSELPCSNSSISPHYINISLQKLAYIVPFMYIYSCYRLIVFPNQYLLIKSKKTCLQQLRHMSIYYLSWLIFPSGYLTAHPPIEIHRVMSIFKLKMFTLDLVRHVTHKTPMKKYFFFFTFQGIACVAANIHGLVILIHREGVLHSLITLVYVIRGNPF